jgi:hypothetical protein
MKPSGVCFTVLKSRYALLCTGTQILGFELLSSFAVLIVIAYLRRMKAKRGGVELRGDDHE